MTREFITRGICVEAAKTRPDRYPAKPLTKEERIAPGDFAVPRKLSIRELTALFEAEQIAQRLIPRLASK